MLFLLIMCVCVLTIYTSSIDRRYFGVHLIFSLLLRKSIFFCNLSIDKEITKKSFCLSVCHLQVKLSNMQDYANIITKTCLQFDICSHSTHVNLYTLINAGRKVRCTTPVLILFYIIRGNSMCTKY